MTRSIQTLIVIMLFAAQALGQGKAFVLKGVIQDQAGKAIADALIINQTNSGEKTISDKDGLFSISSTKPIIQINVVRQGFASQLVLINGKTFVEVILQSEEIDKKPESLMEIVEVEEYEADIVISREDAQVAGSRMYAAPMLFSKQAVSEPAINYTSNESYSPLTENGFKFASDDPLNTFSIDVDRASYSNVRRFINNGQLPPVDAVRIEEMINYFEYDYDQPKGNDPVEVFTEMAPAPWNEEHKLLHVGIQAKNIDKAKLPPSNLVFLIDASGSMSAPNKLPLLKSGMKMLVNELREEDKVAIVVYAGAAGLVLESTSGSEKEKIMAALDRLSAGGSTAGGAGINLAYATAAKSFMKEGNNRIILATDGDFNVGASSDQAMEALIEQKRNEGVFLTVLGFGMGNYKDSKMEILADKGNGNYSYIDNLSEARKTLVKEFGSTLFTIAKDVKIQVEFNPANVQAYRLIGYENRKLNNEDFNDDKKDAGEMGAGHTVTALYEIVPVGVSMKGGVDPLKYQVNETKTKPAVYTNEMATVKLRYKEPDGDQSRLMKTVVGKKDMLSKISSDNLKWSAAMAEFGMLLRNSQHKGTSGYSDLIPLAESAVGKDEEAYRRECIQLMKNASALTESSVARR